MPVEVQIPNLVAGVSQQPPKTRQPGKVEAAENLWLDPALGAVRRPASFWQGRVHTGGAPPARKFVPIDLNGELYFALLAEEEILVFDSDGNAMDVVSPSGGNPDLRPLDGHGNGADRAPALTEWTEAADALAVVTDPEAGPYGETDTVRIATDGTPSTGAEYSYAFPSGSRPSPTAVNRLELFVKQDGVTDADDLELQYQIDNGGVILRGALFAWSGVAWSVSSTDANVSAEVLDVGGDWWRLRVDYTAQLTDEAIFGYFAELQTAAGADRALLVSGFRDVPASASPSISPQRDLRCLTVQDFTFVLNRKKVTAERADVAVENIAATHFVGDDRAFVGVRGFQSSTFTVKVKTSSDASVFSGSHSTGAGVQDSEALAGNLATAINASGTDATALAVGSTILLTPPVGETFEVLETDDTQANTLLTLVWKEVENVSDLPLHAPEGFVVEIIGAPGSDLDDHYVIFERQSDATASALDVGEGFWRETVAVGAKLGLDERTMPYQLVRRFDDATASVTGTAFAPYFEWGPVDWSDRDVGDEETNDAPGFLGLPLTDIAFHRARLALTSEEGVTLSGVNRFFDLYRTTTTSLPDDDRIDLAVSHTERSSVHSALSVDEALMLLSAETVFCLTSGRGTALTPETATLRPILKLQTEQDSAPALYRSSAVVPGLADPNASLHTVFQRDVDLWDESELTAEVPTYLAEPVLDLLTSARAGVLLARTAASLRVWFNSRDGEGRSVQAAWASWSWDVDAVAGAAVVDDDLWLLVTTGTDQHLVRMPLDPTTTEPGETYSVHLDMRTTPDAVLADGVANTLTFTLPRPVLATDEVVDPATGNSLPVVSRAGFDITVTGSGLLAGEVTVGTPMASSLELSRPYPKTPSQLGGLSARRGRFQVSFCRVDLEDSTHVQAVVNATGRDEMTAEWVAYPDVLGQVTQADDAFSFLVGLNPADGMSVVLRNVGPLPFRLVAGVWFGEFYAGAGLFGSA